MSLRGLETDVLKRAAAAMSQTRTVGEGVGNEGDVNSQVQLLVTT